MRSIWRIGVVFGVCSVLAQTGLAQTPSEWTSSAKISNGTCSDGATAQVSERAGSMRMTLAAANGSQFAQFEIALATDGSGKAEYRGTTGALTRLEVPEGSGKRAMKSFQVDGPCQWVWTPN
jgi:hypothetical protein